MIFSKSSRLPVLAGLLCFLLMGFAATSYGGVRFDVVGAPTEVISTGRAEVTGSVTLYVRGNTNITGTSAGAAAQIALTYVYPAMQIDNDQNSGVRIFFSSGFLKAFEKTATSGPVGILPGAEGVRNIDLVAQGLRCVGQVVMNLAYGATPVEGDFIRIEGVRGRIDISDGRTPGTDLFVDIQCINDPTAANFTPDRVRVAKSFPGMNVDVKDASILLCFPTTGVPIAGTAIPNYSITIQEAFQRAFVGTTSAQGKALDRLGSAGFTILDGVKWKQQQDPDYLGYGPNEVPKNGTQFIVYLEGIPASVARIEWPAEVKNPFTDAKLVFVSSTDIVAGVTMATYAFLADNQTGRSDVTLETFTMSPVVVLKGSNQFAVGKIYAAVTLAPAVDCGACPGQAPGIYARPRFLKIWQSKAFSLANVGCEAHDPTKLYCSIIRCQCFILFTYVTYSAGFNTGISVANTSDDFAVFGTAEAPNQNGPITFYFYDAVGKYVGNFQPVDANKNPLVIEAGQSYIALLSSMLGTTNLPPKSFSGYVIARAEFQYCHAFAFIADNNFGSIAHGYVANIIPDPIIKSGKRTASAAADITCLPAGESLNN